MWLTGLGRWGTYFLGPRYLKPWGHKEPSAPLTWAETALKLWKEQRLKKPKQEVDNMKIKPTRTQPGMKAAEGPVLITHCHAHFTPSTGRLLPCCFGWAPLAPGASWPQWNVAASLPTYISSQFGMSFQIQIFFCPTFLEDVSLSAGRRPCCDLIPAQL